MKTLKNVRRGKSVKVIEVLGTGPIRRRIMDMGITKGSIVSIKKIAPLGDPIEVIVRGYGLLLRKEDAKNIVIE
jgi:ferrous iron transport protein A